MPDHLLSREIALKRSFNAFTKGTMTSIEAENKWGIPRTVIRKYANGVHSKLGKFRPTELSPKTEQNLVN
jgi:hypothetical protein